MSDALEKSFTNLASRVSDLLAYALSTYRRALLAAGIGDTDDLKPTGRWMTYCGYYGADYGDPAVVFEVVHGDEQVLIDQRGMVVGQHISDYFRDAR